MSSQPLLGGNSPNESNANHNRRGGGLLPTFSTVTGLDKLTGPSTAYDTICIMLDEPDQEAQDELTKRWRDHKLEELNFVGTVGALLASCLSSTSAWPDVLNNGRDKPWTVRSLWFSGLVFALFSVVIAGLQSMRLHRLSAHRDGLELIRTGLSTKLTSKDNGSFSDNRNQRVKPRFLAVYAWEFSLAFLVASVMLMVIGIAVLVWVSTEYGPGKPADGGWWDENSKMAVTFTSVLAFATLVLFTSQGALMGSEC